MSDDSSTAAPSTPNVVVGTRAPFWQGLSPLTLLYELASPFMVLWALKCFVWIARGRQPFADVETLGAVIVGIVGAVGTAALVKERKKVFLASPCPRCGAAAVRSFERSPVECTQCIAYLRARDLEVSEEAANAVAARPWQAYRVAERQFVPVSQRDEQGRIKLALPAMCAHCGASDAPFERDVVCTDENPFTLGPVGSIVAKEIASDAMPNRRMALQHDASGGSTAPPPVKLDHLKFPVCAKHTKDADPDHEVVTLVIGNLMFISYRYYKAFTSSNKIELRSPPVAG